MQLVTSTLSFVLLKAAGIGYYVVTALEPERRAHAHWQGNGHDEHIGDKREAIENG